MLHHICCKYPLPTQNQKRMENIQISIKSVNVFYMLHRTMSMCAIYSFMQHIKEVTVPQPHPRFLVEYGQYIILCGTINVTVV